MPMRFSAPVTLTALPQNYVPVLLAAPARAARGFWRQLIPAPSGDAPVPAARGGLSEADLNTPGSVAALVSDLGGGAWYFGPPQRRAAPAEALPARPWPGETEGPARPEAEVIGIIDTGIAFWNPRLCDPAPGGGAVSRFVDIGMVDFDTGGPACTFMGAAAIRACTDLAQGPGGDRAVAARLAADWPGSVYAGHDGHPPIFGPDRFSHGTAMADLAAGRAHGEDGPAPALFGIELPTAVLIDSSGASLQIVAGLAIEALLARVSDWAQAAGVTPRLRIVMSMAFLGGPHDGSHPVIGAIRQALESHCLAGRVEFLIPEGNHLQDRIHARLPALPKGGTAAPLHLMLPPDDHGPNLLEICLASASAVRVDLVAPDGDGDGVALSDGGFALLTHDGEIVGAAWCRATPSGGLRLQLGLAATASDRAGVKRAMPGLWRITLSAPGGAVGDIDAWILRENDFHILPSLAPRRQAWFEDPACPLHRPEGGPLKTDPPGAAGPVLRAGTVSVMATGDIPGMVRIGALEDFERTGPAPAWYSGLPGPGSASLPRRAVVVDRDRPSSGTPACGNGGPRMFRVSGSSAGAALAVRDGPV